MKVYTEHRTQMFLTITKGRRKMPGEGPSSEERPRFQVIKDRLCFRGKEKECWESCRVEMAEEAGQTAIFAGQDGDGAEVIL